ncbi:MAG: hypothetical protein MUC78_10540 [Bacteroidales bacterium]|jgi:hypothetical protein|nr:hypothetical protein [Bacteroidales bacterium]
MKKAALVILTIILTISQGYAQKEHKKSILGINGGVTIPFDTFDNKTFEGYSGFAGLGGNAEADFFLYAGRYFGFSSTIGYANVSFDAEAYIAEYDRVMNNYGETSAETGNYQVLKGMLGIVFKIPASDKTDVLLIFQLGCAMSVHPDITVSNSELGVINSFEKNIAWSPASSAGLKINYRVSEKYGISLNYNINYTKPGFDDNTGVEGIFFMPVRYHNIGAGIVINL